MIPRTRAYYQKHLSAEAQARESEDYAIHRDFLAGVRVGESQLRVHAGTIDGTIYAEQGTCHIVRIENSPARGRSPDYRKEQRMKLGRLIAVGIVAASVLGLPARAADHGDGPRATADPSADITDVFAWTSPDATRLNLVMDVVRNATSASRFCGGNFSRSWTASKTFIFSSRR